MKSSDGKKRKKKVEALPPQKESGVPTQAELLELVRSDPQAATALLRELEQAQVELARSDINAFIEYVMREERVRPGETVGDRLRQEDGHVELQRFVDSHQKVIIWGGVGIGKCSTDSTTYTIEDGRVVTTLELRKLWLKDPTLRVWSMGTDFGEPFLTRIVSITENGERPCVHLKAYGAAGTVVSDNHPFWVKRGAEWCWVEASDIAYDDRLTVWHGPLPYKRTLTMDQQEAFDIGFIVTLLLKSRTSNVTVPNDLRDEDTISIRLREAGFDGSLHATTIVNMVANIGERRGFHVTHHTRKNGSKLSLVGASTWLRTHGCYVKVSSHPHTHKAGRYYWGILKGASRQGYIAKLHAYDVATCRAYLAGAMAATWRDGHTQTVTLLRKISRHADAYVSDKSKVCSGALAAFRSIGDYAPEGKALFDVAAESLRVVPKPSGPQYCSLQLTESAGVKRTWAVEVEDPHTHLTDYYLTHNTQQISVARTLFSLGHNVNLRILIVMSRADLAKDVLHQIKNYIEGSAELKRVFPGLEKGDYWTAREIRVKRTNNILTPSVRAIGAETKIDGSRYDIIIIDDSLSFDNTRTKPERDRHYHWIVSVPLSREEAWTLTIFIGNAWISGKETGDAMHRLAALEGWKSRKFPARDPKTGQTLFPHRWPQERLERWAKERPPSEVARTIDCFPAGSLVLTLAGYIPIEKVRVGDRVLTHRGRWRAVTSVMRTRKPLMTITGHGHPGLDVSAEHPFYVRERGKERVGVTRNYAPMLHPPAWKAASSLGKGDYWATPVSFPAETIPAVPVYGGRTLCIDEALMWLAGRYLADGWIGVQQGPHGGYFIVITCGHTKTDALRERLQQWSKQGKRAKAEEIGWHERDTRTAHQFMTTFRGLAEWLLGSFGKGAAHKNIPAWALGMSAAFRRALLDGYLSGDGYYDQKRGTVEVSTVSKSLAFGMKAVANSLGHTVLVTNPTAGGPVMIQGRQVNTLPVWKLSWRVSPVYSHKQTWRCDLQEWTPIRKTAQGNTVEDVYNLSVKGDESYVVDGIVVHNCSPFSNESSRFDAEWFRASFKRGRDILIEDGKPVLLLSSYSLQKEQLKVERQRQELVEAGKNPKSVRMPVGVFTGGDLGFGLSEDADFTALFTCVVHDDGTCLIIAVEKGRYGSTEIIPRIVHHHKAYGSTVFLEAMFTQKWVYETVRKQYPDLPVFPWKTDGKGTIGNKWDMIFGIESVAFDLGTGRWILPCISTGPDSYEAHELLMEFEDACLQYVPDATVHTNDLLMACVLPGYRVMTDRGPVPIEHVCVDDFVLTHTGSFQRVSQTMSRDYVGDVINLKPAGGVGLRVTEDHPVYTAMKWKYAAYGRTGTAIGPHAWVAAGCMVGLDPGTRELSWTSLRPVASGACDVRELLLSPHTTGWEVRDDVIYTTSALTGRIFQYPNRFEMDDDGCFLLGLFLAEGSTGGRSSDGTTDYHVTSFALHKRETHLRKFIRRMAKRMGAKYGVSYTTGNGRNAHLYGTPVARFFRQFGSGSDRKHIPWDVWWRLTAEQKIAVVRGWLVGDGCMNRMRKNTNLKGATISYDLMQQVVDASVSAGIHVSVSKRVYKKPTRIGDHLFTGRDLYVCTFAECATHALSERWNATEGEHWGFANTTTRKSNIPAWATFAGTVTKVAATREKYAGKVYNLHVEGDESYVCENIAVHNCWIMLQGARLRGAQEYLIALSDIGDMYAPYRADLDEESDGIDEHRWGREVASDLRELLASRGLDDFFGPG